MTTQNDIYMVDLDSYFHRLMHILRPKNLESFSKIEFKMYFKISNPTQVQFKYRFHQYRYEYKVLDGLTPEMFVDVVNFFVMLSEMGIGNEEDLIPAWMREPKARFVRGLLKDALDVPHHVEIRRHMFSRGVDVNFEDALNSEHPCMGDDRLEKKQVIRPSLVYWRELGKVVMATTTKLVSADYDDPEVNYDGRS